MNLFIQTGILFAFIIIFYTVVILSLLSPNILSPTGTTILSSGGVIRFKNTNTDKYLSLEDVEPMLIVPVGLRDPITLFKVNHTDGYLTFQSIYNDRYLAIDKIKCELTSIPPNEVGSLAWFSFQFETVLTILIQSVNGKYVSTCNDEIILLQEPNVGSQWILENVASFLM